MVPKVGEDVHVRSDEITQGLYAASKVSGGLNVRERADRAAHGTYDGVA